RDSLLEDGLRRLHAARAAHAKGILVCPTNAGTVVGVDLTAQKPVWTYVYREDRARPKEKGNGREDQGASPWYDHWKNTPPVVADGKVVFTARDAPPIHCLDAKDGSLAWKADQKEGDQYLVGVYGDKVLIVGNEKCRALKLADGREAWSLA